jgi:hypothetical protein
VDTEVRQEVVAIRVSTCNVAFSEDSRKWRIPIRFDFGNTAMSLLAVRILSSMMDDGFLLLGPALRWHHYDPLEKILRPPVSWHQHSKHSRSEFCVQSSRVNTGSKAVVGTDAVAMFQGA